MAFTPGGQVHMTPVKVSTPAAEDESSALGCARRHAPQSGDREVAGQAAHGGRLDLAGLSALHGLGGLGDVFSRVAASQIASTLDRLTSSNTEPAPPAGLRTKDGLQERLRPKPNPNNPDPTPNANSNPTSLTLTRSG